MNIGKACAIFERIDNEKYTEQEKLNAVKLVIEMPTHNGITKDEILNAFRWFFDWAVEESSKKQTNADRIRAMSDEELAEFLADSEIFSPCKNCDFHFLDAMNDDCKAPDGWICTKGYAAALIQEWLQSEVEG